MAMQQHGGGAKVPRDERPAQPEKVNVEENADRAPLPSEAATRVSCS
jgi:hypothetical protein